MMQYFQCPCCACSSCPALKSS